MDSKFSDLLSRATDALSSGSPGAQARAFDQLEEAIAFERAASALNQLSLCLSENPWIASIAIRWRTSPMRHEPASLRVQPSLGEKHDGDSNLPSIIDFAIAASKLAQGTLDTASAHGARHLQEAMRAAFILGSRGLGFHGASAEKARSEFALAEAELAKALAWSAKFDSTWLPKAMLAHNIEQRIDANECQSAHSIASALGWSALAARLELRALEQATPGAEAGFSRKPAL